MRGRVTESMRPLFGTLTTSLSQEMWDATASATTVTFTTPEENQVLFQIETGRKA